MLRLCSQNRSSNRNENSSSASSSLYSSPPGSPESERIDQFSSPLNCPQNGDSVEKHPEKEIISKHTKFKKYMNSRAIGNEAYVPTELEHIANMITHGIWVLPSFAGTIFLLQQSQSRNQYIAALVYGFSLVALFSISTIFHSVFYVGKFRLLKEVLHVCDRAIIYIFIAASYTPWLLLKDIKPGLGSQLCWLIWFLALLGIVYQYYFHERYKHLETLFYLCIGVLPSFAIFDMQENRGGLSELILGGVIYIIGVLFFKSDGRIPCAHAIWHLFVNVGASCHFYAVCKYLLAGTHVAPASEGFKTVILPSDSKTFPPLNHEEAAL